MYLLLKGNREPFEGRTYSISKNLTENAHYYISKFREFRNCDLRGTDLSYGIPISTLSDNSLVGIIKYVSNNFPTANAFTLAYNNVYPKVLSVNDKAICNIDGMNSYTKLIETEIV